MREDPNDEQRKVALECKCRCGVKKYYGLGMNHPTNGSCVQRLALAGRSYHREVNGS